MTKQEAKWIAEEFYKICEEECVWPDTFMDIVEASKYICVPVSTIYSKIDEIPHKKVGKRLIFSQRELRKYIMKK